MSGWFLLASAIVQYQPKIKLLNYKKKKKERVISFILLILLRLMRLRSNYVKCKTHITQRNETKKQF